MSQTVNLGRIAMEYKGEYDNETTYENMDIVSYNGSSYIASQTTKGNLPTNTTYWGVVAQSIKGDKGEKGDTGEKGETGETGATGIKGDRGAQGYTFTPSVSSDGLLSWSNNGSLTNPTAVNIKGDKGDKGDKGEPGKDGKDGEDGQGIVPPLVSTATGNSVCIEDSSDLEMKLKLNSRHKQETTKGKQLLDPASLIATTTKNGVTLTNNGDGTFNISGTATANTNFILYNIKSIYEANHYFGLYSNVKYDVSSWNLSAQITYTDETEKKYILPTNPRKFTNENVNNATIVLYFPSGTAINQNDVKIMAYKDDSVQATEYEPYTGSQASPSIDYPQTVETVKDSVEIIKENSNIMPINVGSVWEYTDVGIKNLFRAEGQNVTNFNLKKGQKIKFGLKLFSKPSKDTTFTIYENGIVIRQFAKIDTFSLNEVYEKEYTATEDCVIKIILWGNSGSDLFEFQMWANYNTLTDYTKYAEETHTLTVQQEMLEGDYIDDVEHHSWAKQILDGSEDWNLNTQYANTFYNTASNTVFPGITEDKDCFILISDKLIWGGIVTSSGGFKDGYMYGFLRGDSGKIFKRINFKSTKFSTVDELKTYLASNPITVYYKLATPTDLPLTDEQKTIMNGIYTYKNVTNLSVDNELATMDVEYYTDTEMNEVFAKKEDIKEYVLPVATATTIGGVKAGTNVTIDADGTISASLSGGETGSSYNDLADKPQIAGTTLSGNKTLAELGIQGSETGKGLSSNDYTTAEKTKLSGIATNANNYTHPTTSGNKHIPAGGSTGKILKWSENGTAVWEDEKDTTYNVVSASENGLMSTTDKSKLDNIDEEANKYVHPSTSGNRHIPSGGSTGQILKWQSDGTAQWSSDLVVTSESKSITVGESTFDFQLYKYGRVVQCIVTANIGGDSYNSYASGTVATGISSSFLPYKRTNIAGAETSEAFAILSDGTFWIQYDNSFSGAPYEEIVSTTYISKE